MAIFRFGIYTIFISCLLTACIFIRSEEDNNQYRAPIQLIPGTLGGYSMPITTGNAEVQTYFDQGLNLMYAYGKDYAARSFREGWQRDSTCAICYWGEAWALGSNINTVIRPEHESVAYETIQKAVNLSERGFAGEKEAALIDAMSARYAPVHSSRSRKELDEAYAVAMEYVYDAYPDDPDVAALYAESLFLLQPRGVSRDLDDPEMIRIYTVLESVNNIEKHPGTCHHYIHAIESTASPEKGLDCANYLASAMPGASHINHMPSHIWNQTGMWDKSVRTSIAAWHSDQKAEKNQAFSIYPDHNLHMLMFAASYDGQGAIAVQAGTDFAKSRGHELHKILALIRFGRFDEILELSNPPRSEVGASLWDFALGYAHLRHGNVNTAQRYLRRVQRTAERSERRLYRHSADEVLHVASGILEGEIFREQGDTEGAIRSFQFSIDWYDGMEYAEPEIFPFSPRHWLGAILLETGRFEEAERIYLEDLEDHPRNGWSLYGLMQALKNQGKPYSEVKDAFNQSWARSDTWITSSRF